MSQTYRARGFIPARHSISLIAVAAAGLVFASACNDGDAGHAAVVHATAGAAGAAGAGADSLGSSGAGMGGANHVASDAGSGGATAGDAGIGGDGGASGDGGAAGETNHTLNCATGGALFVVGNYSDAAGNRFVLRTAAKAATFALIPAGVADPAQPPRLFLVDRLCAPGGALIARDESSSYRVDFLQTGSTLAVCLSAPVATLDAALALPPADSAHAANTGCAGKPFTSYTTEAL